MNSIRKTVAVAALQAALIAALTIVVSGLAARSGTAYAQGLADVGIPSQALVSPPTQIPISQNVDVVLRKTLHNNGPHGPVDVSIIT